MRIEKEDLKPNQWLNTYGNYLYSLAFLKVNHKETAEDLVQETFLLAYRAKDSFRNNSSEKTWLTAILNNKIIDYYRKKDVLKNVTEYITDTEQGFSELFFRLPDGNWLAAASPKNWGENADAKVDRNEFYKILQQCVSKMPSKLVPVFMAKFLDNEDAEVICKDNNISSSNYWVIVHRAKVLMRSCLEKNWFLR